MPSARGGANRSHPYTGRRGSASGSAPSPPLPPPSPPPRPRGAREPEAVAGRGGVAPDPLVHRAEGIADRRRARAEPRADRLARAAQLVRDLTIAEPREPGVRRAVRVHLDPLALPRREVVPRQVPEAAPRVLDVPGVLAPHEVGDDEDQGAESVIDQDGKRVVREGGVAVIEGDDHRRRRGAPVRGGQRGRKLGASQRAVAAAGQGLDLAPEHAWDDLGESQLEARVHLVVAEDGEAHGPPERRVGYLSSGRATRPPGARG